MYRRYIKEHNPKSFSISNHVYKILITDGSGSGKTNASINLRNYLLDIDKICLYANDLFETKQQLVIKKRKNWSLKHCNNHKAFIT